MEEIIKTETIKTETIKTETNKINVNSGNVWVEKWRPTNFDGIVLDPLNKQILKNIINTSYFPNLLFYGPPGTGKTTTIINLVNAYQEKLNQKHKGLMIHLNASDERGIDIIRNQINQFVNSKSLFNQGMKFVSSFIVCLLLIISNNAFHILSSIMLKSESVIF
jgi:DNA polymerase III delta prime subunit